MAAPGEPGSDPGWDDLLAALSDETRDAEALCALLERCRAEAGASGAALYITDGGVLRLEEAVGERVVPDLAPACPPPPPASLAVPGGLLVLVPADLTAGAAVPPPLAALVALAVRLALAKRQLKRHLFEASFRGVEREALYDVGLAITSTLNLDALSEAILTWALALLDARRAALYLFDAGDYRLSRAQQGEARARFSAAEAAHLPADVLPGATHLLSAAIEIDGSPRGLLVVADKESRHGVGPFGDSDRRTLQLFANQAAIALENAHLHRQALEKERLEREMELAAEIQRQILPKAMPEVPGYELWGWNRPARQVGGDYYDLLPTADGRLVVTVGDVSGKGMPAALMVSVLHSALRLMLDRQDLSPALLERLNRHVRESSTPNKFITVLTAALDVGTHRFTYLNAGHNPGLVVGGDGGLRQMPASGLPLGLFAGASYQPGAVDLGPGDLVCLYSDGITEASDPDGEEFGLERLADLLRRHHGEPLAGIARAIDAFVTAHARGLPQGDDQTVVLLRRTAG
jgi:sigma-B regulation protein RsbU (phosphoserine phosphatase)